MAAADDPALAATLAEMFLRRVGQESSPRCLSSKVGGRWVEISTQEVKDAVFCVAAGLAALGVRRGDRVAILAENRPQWMMADHGILGLGAVSVPIYATLIPEPIAYILRDSGAVVAFVSTRIQAAKVAAIREGCPGLRSVVGMDPDVRGEGVLSWDELLGRGRERLREEPDLFSREARATGASDLATLIYTSGTTGEPKGVMLTHDNLMSNVRTVTALSEHKPGDSTLSILPLSHVFERMADFGYFAVGASIAYAESIEKVAENLAEVKPTIVAAVPRLYEKMYARVLERGRSGSPVRRAIFSWAMDVARECAAVGLAGGTPGGLLEAKRRLADRLVYRKVRERTGGRVRFFVSGSAPLAREIAVLFYGMGMPIYEGYGLSETSPVVSTNTPRDLRIGTVGKPIPGVEVRIAPDGEVLCRGPNVMKGYFGKPDLTAEVLGGEGWFHTGDVGHLDPDGFLVITDRKKDLIKTSGGKYVAPQPIENALKADEMVAQAIVVGEARRFVAALIVPNVEVVRRRLEGVALPDEGVALAADARVLALFELHVSRVNEKLSPHERLKKLALLPRELTPEDGSLTPTMKVRRKVVHERYRDVIEAFYRD